MARVWWKDAPRDALGRFTYVSHKAVRNAGIPAIRKRKRRTGGLGAVLRRKR